MKYHVAATHLENSDDTNGTPAGDWTSLREFLDKHRNSDGEAPLLALSKEGTEWIAFPAPPAGESPGDSFWILIERGVR